MAFMAVPAAEAAAGGAAAAEGSAAGGAASKGSGITSAVKNAPGNPLNRAPGKKRAGGQAARQRAQIEQIKAQRSSGSTPATKPEHIPTTDEVADGITSADLEAEDESTPTPSSGERSRGPAVSVNVHQAAHTGGGFLLGVGAWMLGLTFLRDGAPGVRKLLAAKFLNKVDK